MYVSKIQNYKRNLWTANYASKCDKQNDGTLTTKKSQAQTILQMNFPNFLISTLQNIFLKRKISKFNILKLLLP